MWLTLTLLAILFINLIVSGLLALKMTHAKTQQIRLDTHLEMLNKHFETLTGQITTQSRDSEQRLEQLTFKLNTEFSQLKEKVMTQLHQDQMSIVKHLQESLSQGMSQISGQVDKRLSEGFEKTTATFTDIVKRLALIDEAQKKITELSTNVVSLQEILSDKKSRGAFGEVQLSVLLHNMFPETHFNLQHTLKNGKRPDCFLLLPEPTGNIAIDAKFPLETYRKLCTHDLSEHDKRSLEQQFKQDIRKHIQAIAEKYIVPGETADGAVMFLPAEAIFAEIHAHFPELVEYAHQLRVWIVSPTTMMAILTTARAVLKDAATRQQIHIIQEHLSFLAKDFNRFQKRMDNLAKHVNQAHDDVSEIHTSAKKITQRFTKIEKVELKQSDEQQLEVFAEQMVD